MIGCSGVSCGVADHLNTCRPCAGVLMFGLDSTLGLFARDSLRVCVGRTLQIKSLPPSVSATPVR